MTTGIYKLVFAPGVEYVGKSVDIDSSVEDQCTSLLRNKSTEIMQAAYKAHGMPTVETIVECHRDHLDFLEEFNIAIMHPILNNIKHKNFISTEEFELVNNNEALLKLSTIKLLELIVEYEGVPDLEIRLQEKEETIAQLNVELKLAKRPWYRKLFG